MSMPESLASVWEPLYNEVLMVHARWLTYDELFNKPTERGNRLYLIAGTFFYILQTTLIDDVQLTLAKLADPAADSLGHSNATLQRLLNEVIALDPSVLVDDLTERLEKFRSACKEIRQRRNKLIAHYDLEALQQQYASATQVAAAPPDVPLPTKQEIKDALTALASFMNGIELHFKNQLTAYDKFGIGVGGSAGSLLWMIKYGLRYKELLKSGAIPSKSFGEPVEDAW